MFINIIFKRMFDITLSFLGLIILLPLIIIISIIIKITMPGPIFFRQIRVGKKQREFYILKFRSMKVDKAAEMNTDTSKDFDRITKTGKILRKYKLDEIPQLFNVLVGHMSIVGPRPTLVRHLKNYNTEELKRFNVKPGMTGLAQINGGIKISWTERIKYDIEYVNNNNIFIDFIIFIKTLYYIIFKNSKF